ncbi:MAG TPA: DNA repair and recombination protein RadB [Methanoculleus sp.]|jgi:DNA repair protein RadB|uniref:DNA repair and recombination protein RadB n=1 Tax=Methanoculleus sp. TaxID=90427 RepID=UPI002CE9262C|nr:DNA repair and recombination protein RadB [Methanoculleus sp.]HNT06656.1 DNA repair and recombination protein RadB [Methanoculleus sp.]HOC84621.1 DNA repair and recombination protein RadB [Methanoculleus sp.]HOF97184.1 DNA repair and recombination protein RadB [Methanoculleus sp.]HOI61915.1 DNA repair and recombination protein RadB [Methanoculleus sp.]HOS67283.1 DNA repair and recombination protein RadB [Methanoculleus sp.]
MKPDRVSTGSRPLDDLLGGGLERRTITQIYGEPASGKSTFCLMAAVASLRAGNSVIYIDTEGFSVERFAQVAGGHAAEFADRLYLFEPIDFAQQGAMIADTETLLRKKDGAPVDLLVMDSMTALYRTELDLGREAVRRLSHHVIKLLGLAKKYDIPVLITNQIYVDVERDRVSGLGGTALEHISKAIVRLEKRDSVRRAMLRKHRSRPEGISFDFVITEDGIRAV